MCEVYIPIKLRSEANVMQHWRVKHKRAKAQSLKVRLELQLIQKPELPCIVTLTRVAPRHLDEDNLIYAFKKIRDTIADWLVPGLKPGQADGDKRITWVYKQEKRKPKEYGVAINFGRSTEKQGKRD